MMELDPKTKEKELLTTNYLYFTIHDGVNEAIYVEDSPDTPVSNVSPARLLAKKIELILNYIIGQAEERLKS